jgi:hypothetical protein
MNRANFPRNKERKRLEAQQRAEAIAHLTPAQRLQRLDELFGPGLGGARERARLAIRAVKKAVPPEAARAIAADIIVEAATADYAKKQKRRARDKKKDA